MIVCLTGENDAARSSALTQFIDTFVEKQGDMAVERLDGEEVNYERMAAAASSLPFLVPRKLVLLRTPGANKEFAEKLEAFVDAVAETNDVLIVEPKLDKRLSYYKQLKKLTDFREFAVLDAAGLARFAVEYVKMRGGSLALADARFLVERIGTNQLSLTHELDKLLTHGAQITRAAIEALTEQTPQSSVFELLDAAFIGDTKRAMALYEEQRAMQVEPQQILAMLIWQINILAIVKAAGQRSPDEIAREAKLSPYTVKKTAGLAHRVSYQRLKELVTLLRELDIRMKSEAVIPDEVIRYYLLQLAI